MNKASKKVAKTVPEVVTSVPIDSNCVKCDGPDTDRMVLCDDCQKWFHYECVTVDDRIADRDWSCEVCVAARPQEYLTPRSEGDLLNQQREKQYQEQLEALQNQASAQEAKFTERLRKMEEKHKLALRKQRDQWEFEQFQLWKQNRDTKIDEFPSTSTGMKPKANFTTINSGSTAGFGTNANSDLLLQHDLLLLYFSWCYVPRDSTCFTMLRQCTRFWAACLQLPWCPTFSRSFSTWSDHLARCAPLLLVPYGSEANTIFAGLSPDILATCPAHRILPALATFRVLGPP